MRRRPGRRRGAADGARARRATRPDAVLHIGLAGARRRSSRPRSSLGSESVYCDVIDPGSALPRVERVEPDAALLARVHAALPEAHVAADRDVGRGRTAAPASPSRRWRASACCAPARSPVCRRSSCAPSRTPSASADRAKWRFDGRARCARGRRDASRRRSRLNRSGSAGEATRVNRFGRMRWQARSDVLAVVVAALSVAALAAAGPSKEIMVGAKLDAMQEIPHVKAPSARARSPATSSAASSSGASPSPGSPARRGGAHSRRRDGQGRQRPVALCGPCKSGQSGTPQSPRWRSATSRST